MRVLTVTHFFENHGGGIERVAGYLSRHLAAAGHDCEWAASGADVPTKAAGVRVLPLDCINPAERLTGIPMPIPGLGAIRKLVEAVERADALIVHDALYFTSITAFLAARARCKPVVLMQHIAGLEFSSAIFRTMMAAANATMTRPMLRAADQVVFISETVKARFATVPLKRPPCLLFNGVDTDIFHPARNPSDRQMFRRRHRLPEQTGLAAFVGRFVPKKGLTIIRELAARRPELTFALAGAGPVNPAGWGLPNVRLIGMLPSCEIAEFMRAADVLILPSVGEGYPLVIQEALACGLPVICGRESAHADPGAARWLRGVEVDLTSPRSTADELASMLEFGMPDRSRSQEMAAYAAATYSWPVMAGQIGALLESLCAGSKGPTLQPARAAASCNRR